jgi:hypothetical protein
MKDVPQMSVSGLGFLKRLGARKTGERKTGAPQASQQAHPRIVPLSKQSRPFLATKVSAGPDLPSLTDRPTDRPHLLLHYSLSTSPRRIRTLALWHPHPPTAGSPSLKRATQPKGTRALTPPTRAVLYLRQRPQRPPSSPPIFICDGQILAPPAAC